MTNTPMKRIKIGRITATIWKNTTPDSFFYSTSIIRSYKQDGEWQKTSSFTLEDLPVVEKLAHLAADHIIRLQHADELLGHTRQRELEPSASQQGGA